MNTRGDWRGAKPCCIGAEREVRVLGPVLLLLSGCQAGDGVTPLEWLCVSAILAVGAWVAFGPIVRVEWMLWRSRRSWPRPSSDYPPRSRWGPSEMGPRE